MTTTAIHRFFVRSIGWNALEAIAYHALLTMHHAALFMVLPRTEYGAVGALFSLLYLSIYLVDLGFDGTLAPFFHLWGASKTSARRFLIINILLTLSCIPLLLGGLFLFWYTTGYCPTAMTPSVFCIMAFLLVIKLTMRSFKHLLYLLFENTLITTVEVSRLALYIAIIWLLFWRGYNLDATARLSPLIITSLLGLAIYASTLWYWYQRLPDNHSQPIDWQRIAKVRFFSYSNAVGPLLFSSNFLVPLFAAQFGTSCAALLKFASTISHALTTTLYRAFAHSGRAVFARTTTDQQSYDFFHTVTKPLHALLSILFIFCVTNHALVGRLCGARNSYDCYLLLLFFIICLLDSVVITHEKFCEARERIGMVLFINSIGAVSLITSVTWLPISSPLIMLSLIALIRGLVVTAISLFTARAYDLRSPLALRPRDIVLAIMASLIVRCTIG